MVGDLFRCTPLAKAGGLLLSLWKNIIKKIYFAQFSVFEGCGGVGMQSVD